jgi:hypothetical protein
METVAEWLRSTCVCPRPVTSSMRRMPPARNMCRDPSPVPISTSPDRCIISRRSRSGWKSIRRVPSHWCTRTSWIGVKAPKAGCSSTRRSSRGLSPSLPVHTREMPRAPLRLASHACCTPVCAWCDRRSRAPSTRAGPHADIVAAGRRIVHHASSAWGARRRYRSTRAGGSARPLAAAWIGARTAHGRRGWSRRGATHLYARHPRRAPGGVTTTGDTADAAR